MNSTFKHIAGIVTFVIFSIAVYSALSFWILKKPLTIGYMADAYSTKESYAKTIQQPKIVIVAGSNGLYSYNCAVFEEVLHKSCVNFAVSAGLGADIIFKKSLPVIKKGDIVLMPLEYDFYSKAHSMEGNLIANRYLANYDRDLLKEFPLSRQIAVLFSLSLKEVYDSMVEMGLTQRGFQRRFTLSLLDKQGDMTGHTAEKALIYQPYISSLKGGNLNHVNPKAQTFIKDFISHAEQQGATVVGTLPTTLNNALTSEDNLQRIKGIYPYFVTLDNQNRYPASDFYDTFYHLNESRAQRHSHAIAQLLNDIIL